MKLSKCLPQIITQLAALGLVVGSLAVHKGVAATVLACTAAILFALAIIMAQLADPRA